MTRSRARSMRSRSKAPHSELLAEIEEMLHDIKAPLGALVAGIDLLDDPHLARPAAGDLKRALRVSAYTVVEMIETLSSAQSFFGTPKKYTNSVFRLDALIEEVMLVSTAPYRAKDVALDVQKEIPMCRLTADYQAIKRVLLNVLSNALRHAPEGSTVRVRMADVRQTITINISDEGAGFATPRGGAYERYYPNAKGTGLGLTICRRIVEDHGGTFSVDNAINGGALVTIVLRKKSNQE